MIKKHPLLVIIFIILIIIFCILIRREWILIYKPFCKTTFVRVYNTGEVCYYDKYGRVSTKHAATDTKTYTESYIVVNAPTNAEKLKKEIDQFEINTPYINIDNAYDVYSRHYIKESNEFNRNWRPSWFYPDEESVNSHIVAWITFDRKRNIATYRIRPRNSKFKEIDNRYFSEELDG